MRGGHSISELQNEGLDLIPLGLKVQGMIEVIDGAKSVMVATALLKGKTQVNMSDGQTRRMTDGEFQESNGVVVCAGSQKKVTQLVEHRPVGILGEGSRFDPSGFKFSANEESTGVIETRLPRSGHERRDPPKAHSTTFTECQWGGVEGGDRRVAAHDTAAIFMMRQSHRMPNLVPNKLDDAFGDLIRGPVNPRSRDHRDPVGKAAQAKNVGPFTFIDIDIGEHELDVGVDRASSKDTLEKRAGIELLARFVPCMAVVCLRLLSA